MTEKTIDSGTLFRRHAHFVECFLRRQGTPPEDVLDLVQDVFLVAHRKGGFIPAEAKATSWLAAIAIRVASEQRRARNCRPQYEPTSMDAVAETRTPAAGPGEVVEARELLEWVRRALKRIPGRKRAVFVMFAIDGRTCEEIASALHIPIGTVYSRLHSARAQFDRYYESPAAQRPMALSDSRSFVSLGASLVSSIATRPAG